MSHRKPTKDPRGNPFAVADTTVPRRPAPMHPTLPTPKQSSDIDSAIRTAAPPLKHAATFAATSGSAGLQRPSGLPRSSSGHSSQRLDALASSRSPPLPSRSPARPKHAPSGSEDVPLILDYNVDLSSLDTHHDTVLGVTMPKKRATENRHPLPSQLIPELQALATQKPVNRPAPSVSTVSSPSTRFTESPAPWSASTATTTPVSWPSKSPAILQSSKMPGRKSKTVPQPTVPRARLPKLPIVQQGSSESRHVPPAQVDGNRLRSFEKKSKKKPIVDSPAPTPPPRTSSAQRTGSRGDKSGPSSIDETLAKASYSTAPAAMGTDSSPLANRTRGDVDQIGDSLRVFTTEDVHVSLQQSIGAVPSRPSREGTVDLGESRPAVMNSHKAGFSSQHRQLLASAFEDPVPAPLPPHLASQNVSQSSLSDSIKAQRSPSRLGKFSRLGLFTRRGVTPSSDTDKSPRKLQRRGPAAGTGHKGYGKHTRRTQKTSTESSAAASDSERSIAEVRRIPLIGSSRKNSINSSRQNRSSQSDLDEFAAPRLKPVIMRGGSQTSVSQKSDYSRPREEASTPDQASRRTSAASPAVRSPPLPETPRLRSPKQRIGRSKEDLRAQPGGAPTLATRRSQRFGAGYQGFPMPDPICTDGITSGLQVTSYDTSLSSIVPTSTAPSSSAPDTYTVHPGLLRPDDKKVKRPWWNPFKRRDRSVGSPDPIVSQVHQPPGMAVSISTGPAPRSIPYYAMMESESDNATNEQIGDFLSQAVQSPSHSPVVEDQHGDGWNIASEADLKDFPAVPTWAEHHHPYVDDSGSQQSLEQTVKQPRLPQVGRIPKVVSRSERQHFPSRRSFSQPFVRKATLDTLSQGSPKLLDLHDERPQLEIHSDVLPNRPFQETMYDSMGPASAPAVAQMHQTRPADAFLMERRMVPSKHASDVSASSSSEGMISVIGPPLFPTQQERDLLERMPTMRMPSMYPGDDEIWREYDDFIDHVMSPSRSPTLRPRPDIPTLQIPRKASPALESSSHRPRSRGRMPIPEPRRAVLDLPLPQVIGSHAPISSPLDLSERSAIDEIRLRRSRIVSALHSSIDPSSPFSMREFLKDYGPQGRDSVGVSDRGSASTAGQPPPTTPTSGRFIEENARVEHTHRENALLLDTVARTKDPARESELHYASLEVARWLSFGRVLFSPAHHEVHTLPERNVLVIDGLGNEDWSIYCAVNYEADRAIVYDLKETWSYRSPVRAENPHPLPANLRRGEIADFSDRFPFHNAFFSAIVLRFPPAMSEAKMRNIVTECRRTLVPGGHLEIMLLDLDIVNMGVQTRRAVRELKMSMATADPEVSLKPGIDNFQNILGGRGFTGLNRCVVGVPVVGRAVGSMDSSSSSRSSRGSSGHVHHMSGSPTQSSFNTQHGHKFSLNELVADHSEKADAKIGRTVSACARSWWQHCYEATVIPDGDLSRSIFADKRVLQECKSRASSFKLLIAHAQRPVFEARRRTMSEPAAANLATAGAPRRPKALVE